MAELVTNRLWDTRPKDCGSQYARMIPGSSALPHPGVASVSMDSAAPSHRVIAVGETTMRRPAALTPIQQCLPEATGDRFRLFQPVAADLIVLGIVCGASSLFSPAWGLPWNCLPIFAVLVTLFGFSEGLYQHAGELPPSAITPVLARSTLFAVALVFIAAWNELRPLAGFAIFATSLASLLLWRWLRHFICTRSHCDAELRKVLIVGGGPIARSIAHTLRNEQ